MLSHLSPRGAWQEALGTVAFGFVSMVMGTSRATRSLLASLPGDGAFVSVPWFILRDFLLSASSHGGEHVPSTPVLLEHPCLGGTG